jgi:D-glycero-D-manno-heptose 1,7-bisphosphate phosphatase
MKKVVFLDRDGVINREVGDYVFCISDFILNKGLRKALQKLSSKGYSFAIVTNQGGISKMLYGHKEVKKINKIMKTWFKENYLDLIEIMYCPHHPSIESCICRKPNSGMIERIIARHNISIENSFFIGDQSTDILAAKKIGLRAVKIQSNSNLNDLNII